MTPLYVATSTGVYRDYPDGRVETRDPEGNWVPSGNNSVPCENNGAACACNGMASEKPMGAK